jgi:hypothetical protein
MVFLREASKDVRIHFRMVDMMRIMKQRLPKSLQYGRDLKGDALVGFMKREGLILSGSSALGFILGEHYGGDIDLFYHSKVALYGEEKDYDTAPFHVAHDVPEYHEYHGIEIVRNDSPKSAVAGLGIHEIITRDFDLSCVKNTVRFAKDGIAPSDAKLIIEITNRKTFHKEFTLDIILPKGDTVYRIRKYEERGFRYASKDHMAHSTCRSSHPIATMFWGAMPVPLLGNRLFERQHLDCWGNDMVYHQPPNLRRCQPGDHMCELHRKVYEAPPQRMNLAIMFMLRVMSV